jgi:hypothetical protein
MGDINIHTYGYILVQIKFRKISDIIATDLQKSKSISGS